MITTIHPQVEVETFRQKLIKLATRMLPLPIRGAIVMQINMASVDALISLRKELQNLL